MSTPLCTAKLGRKEEEDLEEKYEVFESNLETGN